MFIFPYIYIASVIAKRTFDNEGLKPGAPHLIVIPSGIIVMA